MYDASEHFSIFCTDVGVRTNAKLTPEAFSNRLYHHSLPSILKPFPKRNTSGHFPQNVIL